MLSDIDDSPENCAQRCLQSANSFKPCYGFNVRLRDGVCATFSIECIESSNNGWSFYRRKGVRIPDVPSGTTNAASQTTFTMPSSLNYQKLVGFACVDSFLKFQTRSTIFDCEQECDKDINCYGFYTSQNSIDCSLQRQDCLMKAENGYSWYRKANWTRLTTPTTTRVTPFITWPSQATRTSTLPPADSGNYQRYSDFICAYSRSWSREIEVIGINSCMLACDIEPKCIGFTAVGFAQQTTQFCYLQDDGCQRGNMSGYFWYQKKAYSHISTAQTAIPTSTTASTLTRTSVTSRDTFVNGQYREYVGYLCSFGITYSKYLSGADIELCKMECNKDTKCFGFSVVERGTNQSYCHLQSNDCSRERMEGVYWFEKASSETITTRTTTAFVNSSPTTRLSQVTTSIQSNYANYERINGTICSSGSFQLYRPGLNIDACKRECDSNTNCFGFIVFRSQLSCSLQSRDCQLATDQDYSWYQKGGSGNGQTSTYSNGNQFSSTSRQTTPFVQSTAGKSETGEIYERVSGMLCRDGTTQTYRAGVTLEMCKTECSSSSNCYGFMVFRSQLSCSFQSRDCQLSVDQDYSWYHKLSSSNTPSRFDSSTPAMDYVEYSDTVCVNDNGNYYKIEMQINECKAYCKSKSWCNGFTVRSGERACTFQGGQCTRRTGEQWTWYASTKQSFGDIVVESNFFSGYTIHFSRSCQSATPIGQVMRSENECATLCNNVDNCAGFNWLAENDTCQAVPVGCISTTSAGAIFYSRTSRTSQSPIPQQTPSIPGNSPVPSWISTPLISGYTPMPGKRCSNGEAIGALENDINICVRNCNESINCYGINFVTDGGNCIARDKQCQVVDAAENIVLYLKL